MAHLAARRVRPGGRGRIGLGGGGIFGNGFLRPRMAAEMGRSLGGYVARPEVADAGTFVVAAGLADRAGPLGAILIGRLALEGSFTAV